MALDAIGAQRPGGVGPERAAPPPPQAKAGTGFASTLAAASRDLALSRHAQKRVDRRELDLDPARVDRLNRAVSTAAEKGARQSVVLLDNVALVVNVRDRTVVTAMNTGGGQQRVFTNVDSVVIA
jgi:flagellar operon protein